MIAKPKPLTEKDIKEVESISMEIQVESDETDRTIDSINREKTVVFTKDVLSALRGLKEEIEKEHTICGKQHIEKIDKWFKFKEVE